MTFIGINALVVAAVDVGVLLSVVRSRVILMDVFHDVFIDVVAFSDHLQNLGIGR